MDVKAGNKTITVNCLYRPPIETTESHQQFLETTEFIVSELSQYEADLKVISSDLNFGNCYCFQPTLPFKPLDHSAPELFTSYGFQQLIDIPTRTRTAISLIDLIFVNTVDIVDEFGTLPEIADHEGTLLCLNVKQKAKTITQKTLYDYKNADVEGINNYIKNHDFETSVFTQPVEEQADKYSKILIDCFDRFVPKKTVFIKPQSIPWCNAYTRLLLRQKNRNYKFFKTVTQKHHQASLNPNSTLQTLTQLSLKKTKSSV